MNIIIYQIKKVMKVHWIQTVVTIVVQNNLTQKKYKLLVSFVKKNHIKWEKLIVAIINSASPASPIEICTNKLVHLVKDCFKMSLNKQFMSLFKL